MLLSGGKGKEVSGSLSPLPAESKVFVYKLVGVCWSGRSEAPLPDQANQTNLLITHKDLYFINAIFTDVLIG